MNRDYQREKSKTNLWHLSNEFQEATVDGRYNIYGVQYRVEFQSLQHHLMAERPIASTSMEKPTKNPSEVHDDTYSYQLQIANWEAIQNIGKRTNYKKSPIQVVP